MSQKSPPLLLFLFIEIDSFFWEHFIYNERWSLLLYQNVQPYPKCGSLRVGQEFGVAARIE